MQTSEPPLSAQDVTRGTCRLLWQQALAPMLEVTLADGHRADILAIGRDGSILIVEVKLSAADLLGDAKWQHYRNFCDRFAWAVPAALAHHLEKPRFAPESCGLIIADRHEAVLVRAAVATPLPSARRRAVTLAVARQAAHRLHRLADPDPAGWSRPECPAFPGRNGPTGAAMPPAAAR